MRIIRDIVLAELPQLVGAVVAEGTSHKKEKILQWINLCVGGLET
jgi:hypothetical protein